MGVKWEFIQYKNNIAGFHTSFAIIANDQFRLEYLEYIEGNLNYTLDYISKRISEIKLITQEGTFLL